MLERKSFELAEFKANGKKGEFVAEFSVFDNLDRDGDIVRQGAFAKAFEENPRPPIVWTHRWDIPPIGETLDASETKGGARGIGRLFVEEHEVAAQVYAGLKSGALRQFSYAYELEEDGCVLRKAADEEKSPRRDGLVRELLAFRMVPEWGPTLVGANPQTQLLATAKSVATLLGVPETALTETPKAEEPIPAPEPVRERIVIPRTWGLPLHGEDVVTSTAERR
jgi:HK97 family phage prohead protease